MKYIKGFEQYIQESRKQEEISKNNQVDESCTLDDLESQKASDPGYGETLPEPEETPSEKYDRETRESITSFHEREPKKPYPMV